MRSLAELEASIQAIAAAPDPGGAATELLLIGEEIVEHWITAKGQTPTTAAREGFRLLALHRQGSLKDPAFNACRETCREIAYHYNLITMQPESDNVAGRVEMMKLIANHLFLFVSGKLQVAQLGEFCCSSRPIRLAADAPGRSTKEA